eukprot:s162_g20.t1
MESPQEEGRAVSRRPLVTPWPGNSLHADNAAASAPRRSMTRPGRNLDTGDRVKLTETVKPAQTSTVTLPVLHCKKLVKTGCTISLFGCCAADPWRPGSASIQVTTKVGLGPAHARVLWAEASTWTPPWHRRCRLKKSCGEQAQSLSRGKGATSLFQPAPSSVTRETGLKTTRRRRRTILRALLPFSATTRFLQAC